MKITILYHKMPKKSIAAGARAIKTALGKESGWVVVPFMTDHSEVFARLTTIELSGVKLGSVLCGTGGTMGTVGASGAVTISTIS